AAYVGMHVFEITRRGHCYLSADSTAAPTSLALFSLAVLGAWAAGRPPLPGEPLVLAWGAYAVVFGGGPVAALGYSAALDAALRFLFRQRIAAEERESHVGPDDAPDQGRT